MALSSSYSRRTNETCQLEFAGEGRVVGRTEEGTEFIYCLGILVGWKSVP